MLPLSRRWVVFPAALLAYVVAWSGCTALGTPPDTGTQGPTPSDKFSSAPKLAFDDNGNARVSNSVAHGGVQVFSLGALRPGDRIVIDVNTASGSTLDPNTAIFDGNGDLFDLNDDVDTAARQYQSHIDEIVRWASDPFYLAIAPSFFGTTSGAYVATIHIDRGGAPAAPRGQVVYFNFSGGIADIPNVGSYNLPPFNASRIDTPYAGQTDLIRQTIVDTVRNAYAGLDITFVDSTVSPAPNPPYSEVFFGGFSSQAFGISQNVDHWNKDGMDHSIIYTDHFDDPFAVTPSAKGIGVAIGNVAAHEVGHLLGLEHVADVSDLMDTTGSASTLLAVQSFKDSVLDRSVFPIGDQNGLEILLAALGTSP